MGQNVKIMEIIISQPERKTSARQKVAEWIKTATPSKDKAWVFHCSKTLLQSKKATVYDIVRRYLHYKGYHAEILIEVLTPEQAQELKLVYKKGYEPIFVWLIKKEKK